jgi:hypothetical protein
MRRRDRRQCLQLALGATALLADFGATPLAGSPAEFGTLLTEEIEKWRKVIRFASIKSE